jgi:hypothetical protein
MKTLIVVSLLVAASIGIMMAQEGGVPGAGSVPSIKEGCTCHNCDVCLNYPGTGCYPCGTMLCYCTCFSGGGGWEEKTRLCSQPPF